MLACDSFAGSKRLSAFLRFVVERTLSGDTAGIKEYRIGVEVYQRGAAFDSRIDNIVRVEANRLRTKLREYYEGPGSDDPVRIEIPKGTYTPVFYPMASAIAGVPEPGPALPRQTGRRRRAAMWIAAMALVALAIYAYRYGHSRFAAGKLRRSVAVLGFKSIRGRAADTAWLTTAFSEMLTMDLAGSDQVRAIPLDSVSQMKRDLGLTDSDGLTAANLQRVQQRVGADLAIAGAYTVLTGDGADQIRLDLRVQDTHTGETVATVSETGTERELFSLVDRTAADLRRKLRLQARLGEAPALAALPAAPGAMRLYAEGLEQLRQSNAIAARELLEHAVEADASNALAYSALASAWHALGYEEKARESAQKAYQLAAHLNRVEQLEIEGHYRSYSHQWDDAIRIYETLCRTLPDSIDDGLTLVETQFRAGRSREALASVLKLRKLPPPLRDDPRIDLAQARALGGLADYRGTRDYAARAAGKAKAQGARLFYADARLLESGAMLMLSIPGDDAVRGEARQICVELGDQSCVVKALRVQANKIVWSDAPRAKALYEQGLEISRRMGLAETANLLEGHAAALEFLDDLPSAERDLNEAIALARDNRNPEDAVDQMILAGVYEMEGRLAEAANLYEHVVQLTRASGSRETLGNALSGLADVRRLQGDLTAARQDSAEALAVLRGVGVRLDTAGALISAAECLADAGDLATARKEYEEAVQIEGGAGKTGQRYGGSLELARAELGLAKVALAAKQPGLSQSRAAAAIRDAENARDIEAVLLARAALIRALLDQQRVAEAEAEDKAGAAAAAGRRHPYAQLNLAIAAARLKAATGHRGEALQQLTGVISDASRMGYVSLALEARLAHAEIGQARGELDDAARAAGAQGFGAMAREAREYRP